MIESLHQTAVTNHVGCPPGLLRSKKAGRGHGTGKDILFGRLNSHHAKFVGNIPPGPLTVVRQEDIGNIIVLKAT